MHRYVNCWTWVESRTDWVGGRKDSPLHERMGMEQVAGMNSWLAEYAVSVDI